MIKKTLAKVLAGPIKIYNKMKIKEYYNSAKIGAKEINDLGKTLILVPHVDDEAIGLGGLLKGLSKECEFHLLYGTDSGASKNDKEREKISKVRFLEAEKIAKELDVEIVDKIVEIRNENSNWSFEVFKDHLLKILDANDYDSIFTVSVIDAHPEHQRLTYFLARFLEDYNYLGDIYLYEVSNLLPNDWINTYYKMNSEVFEEKMRLYSYFGSQREMDFDIFNKLNKYKGLAVDESKPLEYFAKMSKEDFVEKVEKVKKEDLSKIIPFRIGNNRSFYKVINKEKDIQDIYKDKGW